MKKLVLSVLILIALVSHGCLFIPVIYTKSGPGSIDPSFITIGVTTKEDIILRCGKPWAVNDDEKVISYQWWTVAGVVIAGYYRAGGAGHIESSSYLRIDFDENDIVKSYDVERDTKFHNWSK
jgi:hypothetical protein